MKRKRRSDRVTPSKALPLRNSRPTETSPQDDIAVSAAELVSPTYENGISCDATSELGSSRLNRLGKANASTKRQSGVGLATLTKRQIEALQTKSAANLRNSDWSAREKSAKVCNRQNAKDRTSDEDNLTQQMADEDGGEAGDEEEDDEGEEDDEEDDTLMVQLETTEAQDQEGLLELPVKRGRGRPKGSKNRRTPTPPPDMPAHEKFFFQNRKGGLSKTSDNTLSSLSLLSHDDYLDAVKAYREPHAPELKFLHSLHIRSFEQWFFELEESFNICLYGWGSKIHLLHDFAAELAAQVPVPKIIMINGFAPGITIREILGTVASIIPSLRGQKLGAQPADVLQTILFALSNESSEYRLTLVIHSLDSKGLRRASTQAILAGLAADTRVRLIASADHQNFPILWDISLRSQFNFLFHDVTTFQPFYSELSVVEDVNELFGRSGRRIDGREGVSYVLKSLTENARSLYTLLVEEQLNAETDYDYDNNAGGLEEDDFEMAITSSKGKRKSNIHAATSNSKDVGAGIEYRTLYRKAMGQLISTHEMGFRTLLKEFYDHQMLVSKKDKMGTEFLSVPFRRDELEAILEELME